MISYLALADGIKIVRALHGAAIWTLFSMPVIEAAAVFPRGDGHLNLK
jgi:hypothetical protein